MTRLFAVTATGILIAALVTITTVAGTVLASTDQPMAVASDDPLADIPADFLAAYQDAGVVYGIDWAYIAAIGKIETDHCRSAQPGSLPDTTNHAGARGCTQFIGSTWRRGLCQHCLEPRTAPPAQDGDGYATDGNQDGHADPWTPADAAASTARYLLALGAPTADWDNVLYSYNHSTAYITAVQAQAQRYTAAAPPTTGGTSGITLATINGITINARIAGQLTAMLNTAHADRVTLTGGGYRDSTTQTALRKAHCGPSYHDIHHKPANQCQPPTAIPGTSMHEQGLAIDFTNCTTHTTTCWQWLNRHAHTYGFTNLESEPWHWSINGH